MSLSFLKRFLGYFFSLTCWVTSGGFAQWVGAPAGGGRPLRRPSPSRCSPLGPSLGGSALLCPVRRRRSEGSETRPGLSFVY